MRRRSLLTLLAATVAAIGPAAPVASQTPPVTIRVDAPGIAVPLGPVAGTVCDPAAWAAEGAPPCDLLLVGLVRGSSPEPGSRPLRGHYATRITVTATGHAPGCQELGGEHLAVSTTGPGAHGTIVALIDGSDSEMCQAEPPSTDRGTFIRSDPLSGAGAYEGLSGGTVNLEGRGTRLGRSPVYRFDLVLDLYLDLPA